MFVRKPKIKYMSTLDGTNDSIILTVKHGRGDLRQEPMQQYETESHVTFSIKGQKVYSAIDESYGSPTYEKLIRRHYPTTEQVILTDALAEYRKAMMQENTTFSELLEVNEMLFCLLESGNYRVSLKKIFPTYGETHVFSQFSTEKILKASVDLYYEWLDNDSVYMDSCVRFMLPTQGKELIAEKTLEDYRKKTFLGRGVVLGYIGFLGCLLDGHHKATVAYERQQALECLVIEKLEQKKVIEPITPEKLVEEVFFNGRTAQLPTVEDYCYIRYLMEERTITTHEKMLLLCERVIKEQVVLQEGQLDCLFSYCQVFTERELPRLYQLTKKYQYKDIRYSYFEKLSSVGNSEQIDEIMLDYLIYDEYDNLAVTKICDEYFERVL
ncbi:hypothetical protein [Brochothrix thermosphacta]|uniref:hypothetical protein n=1 Tax=Brochothrix thermosphacta TaxID=2756 RepID=UPI00048AC5B5|nr:hypothetical protein [Brochothrix thermosphacta]ODJ49164.1 hypothetical protein BFR34_07710 [Brochothrix thermosphacta DSM 20171 = FSL F6-1036]